MKQNEKKNTQSFYNEHSVFDIQIKLFLNHLFSSPLSVKKQQLPNQKARVSMAIIINSFG